MKIVLAIVSLVIAAELLIMTFRIFSSREFRQGMYIILGLITFFSSFWSLANGIQYITDDKQIALAAYRMGSIGWTLGVGLWFLFFYELYLHAAERKRHIYIHLILLATGIVFWGAALDGKLYITDMHYTKWWGWEEIVDKNSPWVIAFDTVIGALIVFNLIQIIIIIKKTRLKKNARQFKLIGFIFGLATIPTALINLAFPVMDIKSLPPLGNMLLGGVSLIIGAIIIRHKVLDFTPALAASQILFDVSDYVFLTDLNGIIRKASNAALNILKYDSKEIILKKISEIAPGLNVKDFQNASDSNTSCRTEMKSSDGGFIPVRCKGTLIKDRFDDPVGVVFVMTDLRDMIAIADLEKAVNERTLELEEKNKKLSLEIAEKEKIELALSIVEGKQRALITHISDVIAIVSKDGIIMYNSPNLAKLFGWDPEKTVGISAYNVVHPDDVDRIKAIIDKLLLVPDSAGTMEYRYRCPDGNYKYVRLTAVNKVDDPQIQGILLNYFDITESTLAEKERQERIIRIQRQQEAIHKLSNSEAIRQGDRENALKLITEITAKTLDACRVSIWFFENEMNLLKNADLYDAKAGEHSIAGDIPVLSYHKVFSVLDKELVISSNDIESDERFEEFRNNVLGPSGIKSLIDVGIRLSGNLVGIFNCAQTGVKRNWTDDEKAFMAHMADYIIQVEFFSERKKMVDKLRLFANTIMSISENVGITDMDDNIIFVNESFCRTYGYTEEELIGKHVSFLRSVKNDEHSVSKILPETRGGGWEGELWNKRKDGSDFLIHLSTSIIKDENDIPVALVGIATDITLKKEEEERLSALLSFQSELLETAAVWINTLDLKGNITFWNKAAEKISGYTRNEVLGNDSIWNNLYPDNEYREKIYRDVNSIIYENRRVENFETTIRRKDGEERIISWFSNNLSDANGNAAGSIAIGVDVTEKNLAEKTLRENEEKYRILLDESTDPIFSFNREGRYLYVNRAFTSGVQKNVEDVIGKKIWDVFSKEEADKRFAAVKYVFETGEEKFLEVRVPRTDGDRYYITSVTPIKDIEGNIISVICSSKDITGRKMAEQEQGKLLEEIKLSQIKIEEEAVKLAQLNEQLIESETKLKELNASKDKFFSIIAHDLKSPFLSLLGYSEILSGEYDELSDDERKESIQGIYQLSSNSYKLLENLLQWARIQIGKIEFNPEPFNLYYEITPVIILLSQTAKNKNISIENNIDRSLFIYADKNMITMVFRNLVTNAVKFSHKGGKIAITSSEEENYSSVTVSDSGVGMDKEQLENLFSIDKTITTTGTSNETGTGLGLLLCKEMVEKHGGTISVKSEKGKGSAFTFTIPKKEF